MKGKKLLGNIAFLLLIGLCMYATYSNYQKQEKRARTELHEKALWMKSQDVVSAHPVNKLQVVATGRDTMSLTALACGGRRIGIYAHRSQCSDCWKAVARNMRSICKAYHIGEPFVLADGFRPIDVRVMAREDSLGVPIYALLHVSGASQVAQVLAHGGAVLCHDGMLWPAFSVCGEWLQRGGTL